MMDNLHEDHVAYLCVNSYLPEQKKYFKQKSQTKRQYTLYFQYTYPYRFPRQLETWDFYAVLSHNPRTAGLAFPSLIRHSII